MIAALYPRDSHETPPSCPNVNDTMDDGRAFNFDFGLDEPTLGWTGYRERVFMTDVETGDYAYNDQCYVVYWDP